MKQKLLIFLILLFALILAAAGLYLWYDSGSDEREQAAEDERQRALYEELAPDAQPDENPFAAALEINPDTVGWIVIPGTKIDHPIVQTTDNDYYLHRDFEKQKSSLGVPFLDYRCSGGFTDFNSIVYGHHIKNDRMFTPLVHFKDREFFDTYTYGWLYTKDGTYQVHFLACMVVKSDAFVYQAVFLTQAEKEAFLRQVQTAALESREFDAEEMAKERLLTLSTCSYEYKNARTVLIGYLERVNKGDSSSMR